jgi:hypothetical protein
VRTDRASTSAEFVAKGAGDGAIVANAATTPLAARTAITTRAAVRWRISVRIP